MTVKAAKVLVGLGIAATALGAWILKFIYDGYRASDVPPALGATAVGLVLLAIGLGKLKRPVVGLAVFVLGGAAAGAVVYKAQANDEAQSLGYVREAAVKAAAEKVCSGTPNAEASPPSGARPILQVITRPDSDSTSPVAVDWEGLAAPRTVAELQLVVCRVVREESVSSCDYVSKTGQGSRTIYKARRIETLAVRDAKTANVLGEKTFQGGEPSTSCDEVIKEGNGGKDRTVTGADPSREDQTAFLKTFVDAK